MLLDFYIAITEPYTTNIKSFLTNRYISYLFLTVILLLGLMLILFPCKMNKLIIYNHTSLLLGIICWYILSKRDYCKSSYFFIGTLCTHLTYFINVSNYCNEKLYILIFLALLYFPALDVVYDMGGFLLMTCLVFSLVALVLKKNIFLTFSVIFMGSCLVVGSLIYMMTESLFGKYGFLGIFVVGVASLIFNSYVKNDIFLDRTNQVVDAGHCK